MEELIRGNSSHRSHLAHPTGRSVSASGAGNRYQEVGDAGSRKRAVSGSIAVMFRTSNQRSMVVWSAVFALSQANIVRLLGPAAPRVLEVQTALSASRYREVLAKMDEADTARFRSHYYPDFVHPLIYALALRAAGRRLGERTELSPKVRTMLAAAPIVSAAGDYVENVVGLHLLDDRDNITDTTVRVTSAISITKWVLALGALGYLSQGFVRVWITRR